MPTTINLADILHNTLKAPVHVGAAAVDQAKKALWSGATTPSPKAIAECRTAEQAQLAVRIATDQGIAVSVLSGGHDWAGRSVSAGGLTLDLRPLCEVTLNANALEMTVGGGALTNHILQALPAELAAVTGTISSVGVAGLTTGGGYGRLNSRFGLASDTLKSAQVVLADGRLVTASEQENADLFWALRGGGGGNFGVVTSMTMSVYRVAAVMNALLFVPLSFAKKALLAVQDIHDSAPDDLSVFTGFMTFPSGDAGLFLAPLWSGDKAGGERWLREISSLDGAQTTMQTWCSYKDTFDLKAEAAWPKGTSYRLDARNVPRLDEATADILLEGARTFPSPACAILLHEFHGACSRIAEDATAFRLRRDHYNCQLIGGWRAKPDENGAGVRSWVQGLSDRLSNPFTPGGYSNLLAPNDTELVRQFFGDSCRRLEEIKKRVDPGDLFRSGTGRLKAE
jgi:FAD/FMN-containing dehydrogenase